MTPTHFPQKTQGHKELVFLCEANHAKCIRSLQNLGLYPIQVHSQKMPGKKGSYENIVQVLNHYRIEYYHAEGLDESSDLARAIEMYLFYGTFKTKKGKRWPVIRAIHRHVTNGRSRFANFSGACFKELLELLDKHPE